MITVTVTPGLDLSLDEPTAQALQAQLTVALGARGVGFGGILADDHPLWDQHSGGLGHADPEWTSADSQLAETFYAALRGKAKLAFDLMLNHPGQALTSTDIIAMSAGQFVSQHAIAGALNGLRLPREAAGRRYPFYWWAGNPSRYAVKQSVAELFVEARTRLTH